MTKDEESHKKLFQTIANLSEEERTLLAFASHNASEEAIKDILGDPVSETFIKRWKNPAYSPKPNKLGSGLKFLDLFSGIGGFRMALQNQGCECLFSSESDPKARETYFRNYGRFPFGDITSEETRSHLPKKPRAIDILCAGFPCQAFSIAGKRQGFEDARGTLFFHVADIIKKHEPGAVFLENVKGLVSHSSGKEKTLKRILDILHELEYEDPFYDILNAKDYGVPQNRERIFIVCFRKDYAEKAKNFRFPKPIELKKCVGSVLEKGQAEQKYYLSETYLKTLENHKARHSSKGNGFGYSIISEDGIANAVVVGGMGRERNLITDKGHKPFTADKYIKGRRNQRGIRMMTPNELKQLQGFPKKFNFPVSDTHAYKQIGNSVAVPAIEATAKEIIKILRK